MKINLKLPIIDFPSHFISVANGSQSSLEKHNLDLIILSSLERSMESQSSSSYRMKSVKGELYGETTIV